MSLGKKISELPVATTLTGLELAVVVQTSTTKQSTPEAITASVSSRLDNVVSVNNAALTSINNTVSALEIRVSAVSARASVNAAAITSINAEVSLKVYRTGDYMTNARYIEFDTSASNGLTTGKLAWNSNDGTLDVGLLGTTVLQIGQETLFYVKNADTTAIADGRLVMATGVVGNSGKIEAQRANGSGAISAEYFLGIATQDIPVGEFGYVTHFGLVRGINATGSQYGQTWAEADLLYANTSIAGGLTNVPPPYPGFSTPLAIVVNPVSNAGSIFVRMKSGEYLEQLHDVDISAKASGDIIVWSSTLGAWTNSQAFVQAEASISALNIQVAAVSALTSVNAAAITSINAVVSLKVNRSGDTMTGPLVVNVSSASNALRITQTGSGNALVVEDSANPDATPFVVDAIGNVGIGTSSPAWRLTAVGGSTQISPGTSDQEGIRFTRSTGVCTINGINNDNNAYNALSFATGASEAMRIDASGNVGIGTSSPLAANRLTVVGGGVQFSPGTSAEEGVRIQRASGVCTFTGINNDNNAFNALSFATGASEAMRIDASGNVGIGTSSPQNRLQVNGSFGRGAPVTKTGSFTLADTENWIICNGTGSITVTFPAASSWTGREVMIKTIAAQTVVSASSDVVPLAGGAAGTAILSATAGAWATLVSDGTNWIIMQA